MEFDHSVFGSYWRW